MTFENKPETPSWFKLPMESEVPVQFTQEVQAVPYSKEEVENEVLDAVKEAKEVLEVSEAKEVLEALEALEVLEAKKAKKAKEAVGQQRALIINLRRQDDAHNRTCASCSRRLPIQRFAHLKKSEICLGCEEG